MEEEVQVNITPTGGTHTILFGKAQEPYPILKPVLIEGVVDAPARFVRGRSHLIPYDRTHVLVNREKRTIRLIVAEDNPAIGTTVVGTLEVDRDLLAFGINANKLYTIKELADLLRLRRQFFREREEHSSVMKALGDFNARTQLEYREADDRKGNTEDLRKRVSTLNMNLEFVLSIPIYKGFEPKTFHVEVLVDVTDGGVRLWLESVELAELMRIDRDSIINEQVTVLNRYVVIEQ